MRPLIYRIAAAFDPGRPVHWLADFAGVARSTAKTWAYGSKHYAYGNCRPPICLLKELRDFLKSAWPTHTEPKLLIELHSLLKQYIWVRQREPIKPRKGFMEIRERDGPGSIPRDGRNRLGRPKRGRKSEALSF